MTDFPPVQNSNVLSSSDRNWERDHDLRMRLQAAADRIFVPAAVKVVLEEARSRIGELGTNMDLSLLSMSQLEANAKSNSFRANDLATQNKQLVALMRRVAKGRGAIPAEARTLLTSIGVDLTVEE